MKTYSNIFCNILTILFSVSQLIAQAAVRVTNGLRNNTSISVGRKQRAMIDKEIIRKSFLDNGILKIGSYASSVLFLLNFSTYRAINPAENCQSRRNMKLKANFGRTRANATKPKKVIEETTIS